MKMMISYLIQVIIASGILYSYYHFVLRNKKFHKHNRFYLIAATVISITIPFLNIPVYFTQTETDSSFVLQTLTVFSSTGTDAPVVAVSDHTHHNNWFNWQNLTFCLYILIASIFLLRIIISLFKIRRITRTNTVEHLDNIHFVNTNEPGTPFSFFRWLFWNRKIELHTEKGEQIFRHELFHIKQKHSFDIIYMELLTVIFWINPFFHLMKKELKAIHEFLADQFAITENTKWQYAELLLMQVFNTNQHLVNPFFHNQIKRRIAMITTSKKTSYLYLRKLMVLPVFAFAVALFAFTYKEKKENTSNSIKADNIISDTSKPIKVTGVKMAEKELQQDEKKIFDRVEIEPSFPGGDLRWRQYLERNLDASVAIKNKAPDGAYTVLVQFIVNIEGNISDVRALTNHGYGMEQEAIRVIKTGPKWLPAIQNGRKVNAYRRQPITFIVGKGEKGFRPQQKNNDTDLKEVVVQEANKSSNLIFDKVEIPPSFPGGDAVWRKYLQSNINPLVPVDSGAPAGTYKVIVQFIVAKDGVISDIKCNTNHGYGMEKEAMRLIRSGPNWNPAIQNGRMVTAYVQQPITFQLSEEGDEVPMAKLNENSTTPEISISTLKNVSVYELLQLAYGTEIVSYQFTIDIDGNNIAVVTNTGPQFNSKTKALITNAKAGRLITIDLIKIKESGIERRIPSKVYKVVN